MRYTLISLTIILGTCLLCALVGCAETTVYGMNGNPVFKTQANMTGMEYTRAADGAIRWTAVKVDHSGPTTAGGNAVSKGILAGGTAVATSGLTKLIK